VYRIGIQVGAQCAVGVFQSGGYNLCDPAFEIKKGVPMPSRQPSHPSEPPSLPPEQAIALIRRQLDRLNEIGTLRYDDPRIDAWESTTRDVLDKAFGKPNGVSSQKTRDVLSARGGDIWINMPNSAIQQNHIIKSNNRKALLEAYIEQLQDGLTPPILATPGYSLHPEIANVSFVLLQGGHYKQAAFEAYIRVIQEVKNRSGLQLDGDQLMNQAFGCDGGRTPVLAFNSLQSDAERDEHRGIMYLFKGIVGLRNAKAHSNTLFTDSSRAHEYLALASLLMRLLEISKKTP
jgi:uncharacterized protein (TIGR02391 family)